MVGAGLAYSAAYSSGSGVSLMVGSAAAQIGLTAGAVTLTSAEPLVPGQGVSGSFTVTNVGSAPAIGPWSDSVYLATGGVYATGDALLATVAHPADLAPGGTYTVTFSGHVPPVPAGTYDLVAVPDSSDLASTQYADTQAASAPVTVAPIPTLTPGTPLTTTLSAGQDLYYQVAVGGSDIAVTTSLPVGKAGAADAYASPGTVPDPSTYTLVSSPDVLVPSVSLPASSPGTWYLDIHGNTTAGAGVPVTTTATVLGLGVGSVGPSAGTDTGPVTLAIRGSGFGKDSRVLLGNGGLGVYASSVVVQSSTTLFATFDLTHLFLGSYGVTVFTGTSQASLPASFRVTSGPGPLLGTSASGGGSLRYGWVGPDTVTLTNYGGSDIDVPVVRVTATSGNDVVAAPGSSDFGYSAEVVAPDFSTPSSGPLPPGVLGPYQSVTLNFGVLSTTHVAHANLSTEAQTVDSTQTGIIDWPTQLAGDQPSTLSAGSWATIVSNVGYAAGEDHGTYATRMLSIINQAAADGVHFASEAQYLGWVVDQWTAGSVAPVVCGPTCLSPSASGTVYLGDTSHPLGQVPLSLTAGHQVYGATSWYDGKFDFWDVPAGTYTLTAGGYLPRTLGTVTVPQGGTAAGLSEVAATAGATLTGTVSGNGQPVAGAQVRVTDADGSLLSGPTGTDGSYSVTGLDPGPVTAVASGPGFLASAPATPTVAAGNPTAQDLALTPGGTITGTVLAAGGAAPPAGTTVTAGPDDGSSASVTGTVAADGTFTITGLTSEPGPSPHSFRVTATAGGTATGSLDGVTVSGTGTTSGVTVQLGGTATVSGQVTDSDTGAPLAGVTVYSDGAGTPGSVTTDSNGGYTLTGLPAASQTLHFYPPDDTHVAANVTVSPSAGQTATRNEPLAPTGSVTVDLQTATGAALPGQPLVLVGPYDTTDSTSYAANLITGSTGQTSLSALLPGAYDLQVPGSPVHQAFTIAQGNRTPTLTVPVPVGTVSGTVTTATGAPVSGGTVTLSDATGQVVSTQTTATGTYSLLVTAAGTYDVVATGPGIGVVSAPSTTVNLGSTSTVNLQGGTASVTVSVTAGGIPVTDAAVTLATGPAQDQPAAVYGGADASGNVAFTGLTPGTYSLVAWSAGHAIATQTVVAAAGSNPVAVALTPGGRISGTVTDGSGPVGGAQVVAKTSGGLVQVATTATDGSYTLADLPVGTYSLSVSNRKDSPQTIGSVAVTSGTVTTENAALSSAGDSLTVNLAPATAGGVLGADTLNVLDAEGTVVASTTIGPARTTSDTSDQAVLGPLADGSYTLQIQGSGTATTDKSVTLASGGSAVSIDQPAGEALIGGDVSGGSLPSVRSATVAGPSVGGVSPTAHAAPHVTPAPSGGPSAGDIVRTWLGGAISEPPQRADFDDDAFTFRAQYLERIALNPNCDNYGQLAALQALISKFSQLRNASFNSWQQAYDAQQQANDAEAKILIAQVAQVLGSLAQIGLSLVTPIANLNAEIGELSYVQKFTTETELAQVNTAIGILSSGQLFANIKSALLSPPDAGAATLNTVVSTISGVLSVVTAFEGIPAVMASPAFGIINNVVGLLTNLISTALEAQSAAQQASALLGTVTQGQDLYLKNLRSMEKAMNDFASALTSQDCPPKTQPATQPPPAATTPGLPTPPPPGPGPTSNYNNHVPGDPNGIHGPTGVGTAQWLTGTPALPYQIQFQNEPTASAAAVFVQVTEPVPANVDPSTVKLTGFGFGAGTNYVAPNAGTTLSATEPSGDSQGDNVVVAGSYDAATSTITWTFSTVNPATGALDDNASAGFLPPDNAAGAGEGYVSYVAQTVSGLPTGSTVDAQATVTFDRNAPIATPVWANSIDNTIPTAGVDALPATSAPGGLPVRWTGSDGSGSGITGYDVYVSVDGAPLTLWEQGTTSTSGTYPVTSGHTYGFAARATSLVGIQGPVPTSAQASTAVGTPAGHHPGRRLPGGGLRRRYLRLRDRRLLRFDGRSAPQRADCRDRHHARRQGLLGGGLRRRHLRLRRRRLLRVDGRQAAERADRGHRHHARRQGLLGGGLRRRHLRLR